jgi:23S rRNA (adenine1618-N6)-methyltransferase
MQQQDKPTLHPRNLHQGRYDLETLSETSPGLRPFVFQNEFGNLSIDFSDPNAVKALNQSLLKHFYQIEFWDIPDGFLCPPVPGRADYIHHAGDLLAANNDGKIPLGSKIKVLDIGTGANLVYPILGNASYNWSFVGSELNPKAVSAAEEIVRLNATLKDQVEIRRQADSDKIFSGIIQKEELFDLTICNPPFHGSAAAAQEGSHRKIRNLTGRAVSKAKLNFGGQAAELWTEGGELEFIRRMILESSRFKSQVFWFTTLVSKSENLKPILGSLKEAGVLAQKVVPMAQGNKQSRFVAWTFLSPREQEAWKKFRWAK